MAHQDNGDSYANGDSGALPVLIVGSGSTGLALAQGLRKVRVNPPRTADDALPIPRPPSFRLNPNKARIKCVVFESYSAQERERDWNMGLHWGAPVLKSLMPDEWWSKIQSIQVDPYVPTKDLDTLSILQGDTGEPLTSVTFGPFYRLRRSKLRALLSTDVDIRYDKRLSNVTYAEDGQSVTAHFTDGTSATGRLLIGADGARSATRQCLLGPEKGAITRLPFTATFIQSKFTSEQALFLRKFHPLYIASANPSNEFAFFGMHDVADPDDPSTWTFFFYISRNSSLEEQDATADWTDAQRVAQQKAMAKNFCDPWKSAYEWLADDKPVWHMGLTDWDPGREGYRWDNHGGLITMVGDAVHPMTYQRGQGLNHSITDAGQLRDALVKIQEGGDKKQLITEFEDAMIQRGGGEARDSTANTTLLHNWEKVKQSPLYTKGMRKNE